MGAQTVSGDYGEYDLQTMIENVRAAVERAPTIEKGKFDAQKQIEGVRVWLEVAPEEVRQEWEQLVSEFWEALQEEPIDLEEDSEEVDDIEREIAVLPPEMQKIARGLRKQMQPLEEEIAEIEKSLQPLKDQLNTLRIAYSAVVGRDLESLNRPPQRHKKRSSVDYEEGLELIRAALLRGDLMPIDGGWTRSEIADVAGLSEMKSSHVGAILKRAVEEGLLDHNGSAGRGARYLIPT